MSRHRRRERVICCDESDFSGKHFGNSYGGLLVDALHQDAVEARLKARCAALRLNQALTGLLAAGKARTLGRRKEKKA